MQATVNDRKHPMVSLPVTIKLSAEGAEKLWHICNLTIDGSLTSNNWGEIKFSAKELKYFRDALWGLVEKIARGKATVSFEPRADGSYDWASGE